VICHDDKRLGHIALQLRRMAINAHLISGRRDKQGCAHWVLTYSCMERHVDGFNAGAFWEHQICERCYSAFHRFGAILDRWQGSILSCYKAQKERGKILVHNTESFGLLYTFLSFAFATSRWGVVLINQLSSNGLQTYVEPSA